MECLKANGELGWRSGESTRLPPMWPWFKSQRQHHMWVEFVVGSLPCSKRFFSGYSGFPLSSKTNISKFQFDQESGRRGNTMWMCYLQIIIYLLFYLFIYSKQLQKFTFDGRQPSVTVENPRRQTSTSTTSPSSSSELTETKKPSSN